MYYSYEKEVNPKKCSKPLDQEIWRAWQEKNRFQDMRNAVSRIESGEVVVYCSADCYSSSLLIPLSVSRRGEIRRGFGRARCHDTGSSIRGVMFLLLYSQRSSAL